MRGHLWTDLSTEIVEEFAALAPQPFIYKMIQPAEDLAGNFQDERDAQRFQAEYRQMREVAYDRRHGRVKSPNRCSKTYCMELRDGENKMCEKHREIARKAASRYKEKQVMRERLQEEREGITHHFTIIARTPDGEGVREIDGYLQTGMYPDGRLGEIFVKIGKSGDETAWIDQWAILASVALQHGVPVETVFGKHVATNFEPSGRTKNKDIPSCTSILDYVSRYLLAKFGPKEPS